MTEPIQEREIPFLPRFIKPILSGEKTMTLRSRWHGEEGEVLTATSGGIPFARIRLKEKRMASPKTVRKDYWRQEGCISTADFDSVWRDIHPFIPPESERVFRLHVFELVEAIKRGA